MLDDGERAKSKEAMTVFGNFVNNNTTVFHVLSK